MMLSISSKSAPCNPQILVAIREMVLHGELAPGDLVRELQLAAKLGVSKKLVRESLAILTEEGMLTQAGLRGYEVRAFTTEEIMCAIDVRGALEGLAAQSLAEHGPPRWLIHALYECLFEGDKILAKRCLESSDAIRYGEMNARFHSLIARGADSRVISDAIEHNSRIPFVSPSAVAFARVDFPRMHDLMCDAHTEHHAIVRSLECGEGQRLAAQLAEHAYRTKARIRLAHETRHVSLRT